MIADAVLPWLQAPERRCGSQRKFTPEGLEVVFLVGGQCFWLKSKDCGRTSGWQEVVALVVCLHIRLPFGYDIEYLLDMELDRRVAVESSGYS